MEIKDRVFGRNSIIQEVYIINILICFEYFFTLEYFAIFYYHTREKHVVFFALT